MRALRVQRVLQRRLCTYIEPELRPRKGERVDSVTDLILKERAAHMESIANAWCTDKAVVARIKKDKLGSKKGSHAAKRSMQRQESAKARQDHKAVFIGRGGAGVPPSREPRRSINKTHRSSHHIFDFTFLPGRASKHLAKVCIVCLRERLGMCNRRRRRRGTDFVLP